jgi:hypothetical protein
VGSKDSQCQVVIDNRTTLGPNTIQPGGSGSSYYTTAAPAVVQLDASPQVAWTKSNDNVTVANSYRNSSGHSSNEFSTSPAYLVGDFAGGRSTQWLLLDSGDALGAVQLHLQDEHGQLIQPAVLQRLTITAQAAAVTPAAISDTQLIGVTSTVASPTGTSQTISYKHSSNNLVKAQTSSINSNSSLAILFNKLQLEGAPGAKFNVTFRVQEAPSVLPAVLQVELKPCAPGQAVKRGRDTDLLAGCTNCSNPFFSFDPTYPSCSVCPPAEKCAHCSGDAVTPAGKHICLAKTYGPVRQQPPQLQPAALG